MQSATVTVPARFNGPPQSANGGWFAGALAHEVLAACDAAATSAVSVRLLAPPPLDRELHLQAGETAYDLIDGEHRIASATLAPDLAAPPSGPVSYADALAAGPGYEGLLQHPFPTCYSCGTRRTDGLALRPGPVASSSEGAYAAAWLVEEVSVPIAWAAMDCPGGWSAGIAGRPMVLGTMTAAVYGLPEVGDECVVMAWPGGGEGRRFHSSTALFGPGQELLGRADAIWIAVDPAAIRPR